MNSLRGDIGDPSLDEADVGSSGILFEGDRGELPVDARRALVQLLLGPSIDYKRQTKLWPAVRQYEDLLRSRLHDVFLDLVVDIEAGVAFTRRIVTEGIDAPTLLRRQNLTLLDSALLLFLRQRVTMADAEGDRATIAADEMSDHLKVFEPSESTDHAKFARQIAASIEKMKKMGLLQSLRGTNDRFEISQALKLLFPASEIEALQLAYIELAVQTGEQMDGAPPASDENEGTYG